MKCPSWTAAKVAIAATMETGITDQYIAGTARKSSNPVTLQNSRPMEPAILSADMTLGKCFTPFYRCDRWYSLSRGSLL